MGLFRSRVDPRDNLIATLRAELSDLKEQHRQDRVQWESDRRELIDRVMALTAPAALRGVRRTPPGELLVPASGPPERRRINYPGSDARVLPPYPPNWPVAPPQGDGEGAA